MSVAGWCVVEMVSSTVRLVFGVTVLKCSRHAPRDEPPEIMQ